MVTQADMGEIDEIAKRSKEGGKGAIGGGQKPLEGGMFGGQPQQSPGPEALIGRSEQESSSGGGLMEKIKKLTSMFGGGMGMGG